MKKALIITGATGYFGKYFVEAFSDDYQVVALSRSIDKLNGCFGDDILKVECDLNDLEHLQATIEKICDETEVGGLINNAYELGPATGFNTPEGRLDKIQPKQIERSLTSGLVAPFILAQAVGRSWLKKKTFGSIVNVSSMYASVSPDPKLYEGKNTFNPISYGMTKAGLEAMTRYMACFWGAEGIRVNAIAPGPFPNIESQTENSTRDEEFLQRLKDKTTVNDFGHPSDLIGVVELLLSDKSKFINGEVIHVDGGWRIT